MRDIVWCVWLVLHVLDALVPLRAAKPKER